VKIDNSVNSLGGLPPGKRSSAAKPTADASSPGAGAEVGLSPLSARLQEISGNLANTPVVDAGRVAEIKQAIADGRFKMDAGKIADGLIKSVREMLTAEPR
jgi:negative regulator of flagellin synthesis FlgM